MLNTQNFDDHLLSADRINSPNESNEKLSRFCMVGIRYIRAYVPIYKMAVHGMPGSGKPQEMVAWAGIDAGAIVKKVRGILS